MKLHEAAQQTSASSESKQVSIPETLERLPVPDFNSRPHEVLRKFRERSPAVPIETEGVRYWLITRYQDVKRVLGAPNVRDRIKYRHAINAHCVVRQDDRRPRIPHDANRSLFYKNGETHQKIRGVMGQHLTQSRLKHLAQLTEEVAQSLLDNFRPGQHIDLMEDYARPLAARVFCEFAGLPANDRNMGAVLKIVSFLSPDKARIEEAVGVLVAWATEHVEMRRQQPGQDLFSDLLRLQEELGTHQEQLTSEYILSIVFGMEPANAIGNGAFLFLTHPDQLAKALAQPSLFESGIDEIVRFEPTFRVLSPHYTIAPLELEGMTVPAGELLLLSPAGANRDPNFMPDADVFDITRKPTAHLGFGHGEHKCLGMQLGKNETSAALRLFFSRFPATQLLEPPEKARWHRGKHFRKLEALPVIVQ